MKIAGLITEYNPFHKGHEYHIEETLRITGADKVIVVMSGDFVQRGTPAVMPKHLRAEMALKSGVSLVLELPVRFATASAEYFAMGAVDLLNQLGCVDSLCFGSECGNISHLTEVATVLLNEPDDYKSKLNSYLKNGLSFPKSRQLAFQEYSIDNNIDGSILSQPNNILGIEYIKALIKLNSSIKPYTIKRETNHYHDTELGAVHSSATSIRKIINETTQQNSLSNNVMNNLLLHQLPQHSLCIMTENHCLRFPINMLDFSLLLHHKLLQQTSSSLQQYFDVTPELANRIIKYKSQFIDTDQFIDLIKSKNITRSRVSRCLLHILLDIPNYSTSASNLYNQYIRVLGFRKNDSVLLTTISEKSSIPLVTKLSQTNSTASDKLINLLQEDVNSSNLYELVVSHKFNQPYISEPKKTMIII